MHRCYYFIGCLWVTSALMVHAVEWRAQVLPVELTVGYAVHVVDLSGDGKLDIAIVDSKRFIWLEAPDWKLHTMHSSPDAKADNVCFAPYDIDGDGDLDWGVGHDWQPNNTDHGGRLVGCVRQRIRATLGSISRLRRAYDTSHALDGLGP